MGSLTNTRITQFIHLPTPQKLKEAAAVDERTKAQVQESRAVVSDILHGKDTRLLCIVGPCSIHDVEAAYEYAQRLKKLSAQIAQEIFVLMRCYFEKPRTRLGWRGMIVDPHLDDSYDMKGGLTRARTLLRDIAKIGMYVGTEVLDPIIPQYLDDLISWAAVGARTIESQIHRDMVSGLSMPTGFKNGTGGAVQLAVDAMLSSRSARCFLGVDQDGRLAVAHTKGNNDVHLILRGGTKGPNFSPMHIKEAEERLAHANLAKRIMVDCSHGNSQKDFTMQKHVLESVLEQRSSGTRSIFGVMIESNLYEGRQELNSKLSYGTSITDACIGWEETEKLLLHAAEMLAKC